MAMSLHCGQPVFNPSVPFIYGIPVPIPDCGMFVMEGSVPVDSQGFAVNLQVGPSVNPRDDVALHLGFTFAHGSSLTVNTISRGQWEVPVNFPNCALQKSGHFQIMILVQRRSFMIALNGQHFCEFHHRRNPDDIRYIAVDGKVILSRIQLDYPGGNPQQSAPIGNQNLGQTPFNPQNVPMQHYGQSAHKQSSSGFPGGAEVLGALGAAGAMAAPFFYPGKQKKMDEKAMKNIMKHGGLGTSGFLSAGHSFGKEHKNKHGHGGLIGPAVGAGLGAAALGYGMHKIKHKKHGGHHGGFGHSGHKSGSSSSSSSSSSDSD